MGLVANRCIKETYSRVPIVELNPDPDYWTEIVEDGIKTLGPGFDVSAEVFASKAAPSGPISAMKITTVSPPPSGVRPTPTSLVTTSQDSPWCLHGASPRGTRLPNSYCMCGPDGAIYYSVATGGANPCPYTATPGPNVTWSTMGADPTTTKDDPPVKPYKTGTCSMHIFESATGGDIGLPEDGSHDQGWRW